MIEVFIAIGYEPNNGIARKLGLELDEEGYIKVVITSYSIHYTKLYEIFTGQQALELKLVDQIGTMNDAIEIAAELGGIEGEPNVTKYPKKKTMT